MIIVDLIVAWLTPPNESKRGLNHHGHVHLVHVLRRLAQTIDVDPFQSAGGGQELAVMIPSPIGRP